MEEITLTIDGQKINCPPETSIFDAAELRGIKIPNLCYHPDLKPFGSCRLCMVEDEKSGRILASCVTPVAPNMLILTNTPRIKRHRINIVRLMMAEHPESCIVCSKGNRCRLRQIAAQLGLGETDLYPMPNYRTLEQANPFIIRDLSKCILCGKCIRADHELVVVGAIDYNLRGFNSRPATLHDLGLETSNCTFCGTCVSICPTGALAPKNTHYVGTPERESVSICGFCGVGCSLNMGVANDRIIETNPSHIKNSVNGSTLCVRGHFAHDFLNVKDRLTDPLLRVDGELASVPWDKALAVVADRLINIKKEYGPQSVGLLGSSKCTNEENYIFQKMARVLLGTNNVDNGGFLNGRSALGVLDQRTGGGCRVNPLEGLETAEAIFMVGADPSQSVPVASYYLKRAAVKGTPIVIVDPRKTEMVVFSTLWLSPVPHTDHELINGLAALLCRKDAQDDSFIESYTEDFVLYRDGILGLDLERICRLTGVDMKTMEDTCDLLEGKKITFLVGNGILLQRHGMLSMESLLNLSLMTGSLGHDGGSFYAITKENNQVGAWDMGAVPGELPGRMALNRDLARHHWERVWGVKISPDQGLNMVRMIEEAEKGTLKAMYVMGENPLRALPQGERVLKALGRLEFLVVQDILFNETAKIADVVLPGASFCEKDGSFTNMEGRIQSFKSVVPPPKNAKADWEILDLLGKQMGYPRLYGKLEKVRTEIAQSIPMYAGLDSTGGVTWIREEKDKRLFNSDGQGALIPFSPVVPIEDEVDDNEYTFRAILVSLRYHLGAGTRTSHSERIRNLGLKGELTISPEDAATLNLTDGDTVQVQSLYGSVIREIKMERGLRPGLVFLPTACDGNDVLQLLDLSQLGIPDSPGWKECRARIIPL